MFYSYRLPLLAPAGDLGVTNDPEVVESASFEFTDDVDGFVDEPSDLRAVGHE